MLGERCIICGYPLETEIDKCPRCSTTQLLGKNEKVNSGSKPLVKE